MKNWIRRSIEKISMIFMQPYARELYSEFSAMRHSIEAQNQDLRRDIPSFSSKVQQRSLWLKYREMASADTAPNISFRDVGFRCFSQFEEDGILLYILGLIGVENRIAVEICAGDGIQCNAANLIMNHGWSGYLFDGNQALVNRGKDFYANHPDTFLMPPHLEKAWITAENINQLLSTAGVCGEIGLLSLDIDGMDYWIWQALTDVEPIVVVCETMNVIPSDLALTVPYTPDFVISDNDYFGVSLRAMTKLAKKKGYRLVGAHRYGFNVFFVKNGVAEHLLPEVSVESCHDNPYTRLAQSTRWTKVKDMPWVSV